MASVYDDGGKHGGSGFPGQFMEEARHTGLWGMPLQSSWRPASRLQGLVECMLHLRLAIDRATGVNGFLPFLGTLALGCTGASGRPGACTASVSWSAGGSREGDTFLQIISLRETKELFSSTQNSKKMNIFYYIKSYGTYMKY